MGQADAQHRTAVLEGRLRKWAVLMQEIIVVPTYKREALLFLCLEAIRKQERDAVVIVSEDRGASAPGCWSVGYGNTGHVLRCLRSACEMADIVHYIENDTIVHPGYFKWARAILGEGLHAAVCGLSPSEHIENWYSAPCVSWNAACLRTALSHITPEYLNATTQEEQRVIVDEQMFPKSRFYRCYSPEHDGYLLRCIENHGWKTAFPPMPLATHAAIGGYNRPPGEKYPEGTFEEQVQYFREMLCAQLT